jgi:hypothetical protein
VCNTLELVGDLTENKDGSIDSLTTYTFYVRAACARAPRAHKPAGTRWNRVRARATPPCDRRALRRVSCGAHLSVHRSPTRSPTFAKAMRTLILRLPPSPPPSSGESLGSAGAGVRSTLLFTPTAPPSDASAISLELAVLKVPPACDSDRNGRSGKQDAGADDQRGALKARADAEMPDFDIVSAPANLGAGRAVAAGTPPPLQGRLRARAATYRVNLDAL